MATKPPNGIYTFSGRPGSSYKYENNQWFVSNSGTKNQYVPMQDPTGNRAKTLEAGLKSGKTQFTQILPTKSNYNQLNVSTPLLPYTTPVGLGLGAAQKYPNGGGMKTVKSKDGIFQVGSGQTGPVTSKLRDALLDIQTGAAPDQHGWMYRLA